MYYFLETNNIKQRQKAQYWREFPVEGRFTSKHLLSADVLFVSKYSNEYQWLVF